MTLTRDQLWRSLRWLEPVGQAIVLAAIALQLFVITPAQEYVNKSRLEDIVVIISCISEKVGIGRFCLDDINNAQSDFHKKISLDYKLRKDADVKYAFEQRYTYILIFFIGSIFAVVGKIASIAASKK